MATDAIGSNSAAFQAGINTQMNALEKAKLTQQVDGINKQINMGKIMSQSMGKDDFLKILITQLTTQDPTDPLKDKDFIAQMAQFSSLEQMTNMSTGFNKVSALLGSNQALGALGKGVEIQAGDSTIRGKVSEVTPGPTPQVLVDGKYYDFSQVQKIFQVEAN